MDSTAAVNLETGKLLCNRYRVEKVLGQGGMGAVYLACDGSLGDKRVAIKEMRVVTGDDKSQQAALKQFRQEAQFLANLEHPNLVHVSDFFSEEGRHYLVMAFVKGQNLGEMLSARRGAFPVAKVVEWGRQLASVLNYLHTQETPILFRDLKPSNIMLDAAGNVRLIDFGIARSFNPEGGATATFLQGMGSAGYSPLEQYQGAGGTDPRSDIYALGATLFHLLTNRVPPSPVELVSENKPMPSPRRWNPTLPPALEQILLKMLAVRKDERYQSMDQVQALLDQAAKSLDQEEGATESLGSAPSLPPPPSAPLAQAPTLAMRSAAPTNSLAGDPNSGVLYMTIGMLTMAAFGLFAFLFYQANQPTPTRTPRPVVAVTPEAPPSPKKTPVAQKPPGRPSDPRPKSNPLATRPHSEPTRAPVPKPSPSTQPAVERPSLPTTGYPGHVPTAPPPRPQVTATPEQLPPPVEVAPPPAPAPVATRPGERPYPWTFPQTPGWEWHGRNKGGWRWTGGPGAPPLPPEPDANGNLPLPPQFQGGRPGQKGSGIPGL